MARRQNFVNEEPLARGRRVDPAGPIYDVRSGGTCIEWTDDPREALAALLSSRRRDRCAFRVVNGVRIPIVLTQTAAPAEAG